VKTTSDARSTGRGFTQSEIRDATDIEAGNIGVVLSQLEDRGLVRHKGNYWALGEADDVAAYASTFEVHGRPTTASEEDVDEGVEHADDKDEATE
jgi:hypothetical protein